MDLKELNNGLQECQVSWLTFNFVLKVFKPALRSQGTQASEVEPESRCFELPNLKFIRQKVSYPPQVPLRG